MNRIKASREVGNFFFFKIWQANLLTILYINYCIFSFTNVIKYPENDTFIFLVKNSFQHWVACLFLMGIIIDFIFFSFKNKKDPSEWPGKRYPGGRSTGNFFFLGWP